MLIKYCLFWRQKLSGLHDIRFSFLWAQPKTINSWLASLHSFRRIVWNVNNTCLLKLSHFIHSYIWILITWDLFIFYYYCIGQSECRIPLSLNRFQKYPFRTEVIVLPNDKRSFHLIPNLSLLNLLNYRLHFRFIAFPS